jgi:hypothetical protein
MTRRANPVRTASDKRRGAAGYREGVDSRVLFGGRQVAAVAAAGAGRGGGESSSEPLATWSDRGKQLGRKFVGAGRSPEHRLRGASSGRTWGPTGIRRKGQ